MSNSERSGVIFLLGAGASCDAGLPIMKDFFGKLRESFEDDKQIADEKERELIDKEEKLFNFVQRTLREASNPFYNPDNFEDVIAAINDLRFMFRSRLFPFVEKWSDFLNEFHGFPNGFGGVDQISPDWPRSKEGTFDEMTYALAGEELFTASEGFIYDRLYNRVRHKLQNWLQVDSTKHDVSYLAKLADFAQSVDVFTLNYDLAVETACLQAGIPWTTGFRYNEVNDPLSRQTYLEGEWFPSEFDDPQYRVKLYKLHGSLSWYRNIFQHRNGDLQVNEYYSTRWDSIYNFDEATKQQYLDFINANPPTLLFAGSTKLPGFDPYVTLFAQFIEKISHAKILVIIGCQWHSEHLLSKLISHQARKLKEPLQIIWVTKSTTDNSYNHITCGAKQALESDIIQKALNEMSARDEISKQVKSMLGQFNRSDKNI